MSVQETSPGGNRLSRQVGENVRRARKALRQPRRAIAGKTGVSERYLGQLETGRANISLNVLDRVAAALDLHICDLIDGDGSDSRPLRQFIAKLSGEQQRDAIGLLARRFAGAEPRSTSIALVGLRGAGKTTLGTLLAERLGVKFVQLSQLITERVGMTTQELVELAGLDAFRRLEREALEALIDQGTRVVLETSGGIVGAEETYRLVLANFHTIWIKARPEDHMQRVIGQNDLRPMEGRPQAMDDLRSLLANRESAYDRAHGSIDTSGLNAAEAAGKLTGIIPPESHPE